MAPKPKPRPFATCPECGEPFQFRKPSEPRTFCSIPCANAVTNKQRRGRSARNETFKELSARAASNESGVVRVFKPSGQRIVVDARDAHWVIRLRWSINDQGYAFSTALKKRLHRVLVDAPPGSLVDHRDGNTLDNRRDNLRITDKSGNNRNMRNTRRTRRGEFKGVRRTDAKTGFSAQVQIGKRPDGRSLKAIGPSRPTEEEAARDYDRLAIKHFGEFAATNFPREEYENAPL